MGCYTGQEFEHTLVQKVLKASLHDAAIKNVKIHALFSAYLDLPDTHKTVIGCIQMMLGFKAIIVVTTVLVIMGSRFNRFPRILKTP